jgi:peptidoglycan-associated lipoprotein
VRRPSSMLKLRSSIVAIGVLCGLLGLAVVLAPRVDAQDIGAQDQGSDTETAAELLEDGLDALSDRADESGRRLLARVVSDYPGTIEAQRAKRALAALDRGESDPDGRAAIKADEAERTAEYRHAFLVNVGDRVFFAENSAILGGRARSLIEHQARWLNSRPDLTVVVIGRADDEGDRDAARDLSLQRALAVRDRLVAAGLAQSRIEVQAAGNEDRIAVCNGPSCEAQNRNAEVFINERRPDSGWQSSQQMSGSPAKASADSAARPRPDSTDQFSQ